MLTLKRSESAADFVDSDLTATESNQSTIATHTSSVIAWHHFKYCEVEPWPDIAIVVLPLDKVIPVSDCEASSFF